MASSGGVVDPLGIAKTPVKILEYKFRTAIRLKLLRRQFFGDVGRREPTAQIEARPVIVELGHESIVIDPWITGLPLNIPGGHDGVIQIIVAEDRPHLSIPGPAQRTSAHDVETAVGSMNIAVMDIYAILVYECRIRSFPGCDAATAAPELNVARVDPGSAKSIKEISLASYGTFGEVCAPDLADVDLKTHKVSMPVLQKGQSWENLTVSW